MHAGKGQQPVANLSSLNFCVQPASRLLPTCLQPTSHKLAVSLQIPAVLLSEHVLLIHDPLPEGSVLALVSTYVIVGMRLEEARADIVFGSRLINSASGAHCPFHGRNSCLPHHLVASVIIVSSIVDYMTESSEV